jgi:NADH-quinone oxidoreductase subunit B
MPEPKYVLAMGACASGGGPFKEGYNVVSGVDEFLPVGVYVAGCPPTPQALLNGFITLQKMIDNQSIKTVRWYQKGPETPLPVPILGPDLMDPRKFSTIKEYSQSKLLAQQEAAQSAPEGPASGEAG